MVTAVPVTVLDRDMKRGDKIELCGQDPDLPRMRGEFRLDRRGARILRFSRPGECALALPRLPRRKAPWRRERAQGC